MDSAHRPRECGFSMGTHGVFSTGKPFFDSAPGFAVGTYGVFSTGKPFFDSAPGFVVMIARTQM